MSELKVWERRVTGIENIHDPGEKELVDRFNKDFARVLRVIPKDERRILFDILYTINKLYNKESVKKFKLGLSCGYKGGLRYSINSAKQQEQPHQYKSLG